MGTLERLPIFPHPINISETFAWTLFGESRNKQFYFKNKLLLKWEVLIY